MKRRWTREDRERAQRKAENDPLVRKLREFVARGQAELDARRKAEGR